VLPAIEVYYKVTFRTLDLHNTEENNQLWSTATEDDEDYQEIVREFES
jgi:hypothetical protein